MQIKLFQWWPKSQTRKANGDWFHEFWVFLRAPDPGISGQWKFAIFSPGPRVHCESVCLIVDTGQGAVNLNSHYLGHPPDQEL